jgi:hypothetical protein
MIPIVTVDDGYGSFSAGQGHEVCWSNTMQMTGQVECNWVDKSVHYPAGSGLQFHFTLEHPAAGRCFQPYPQQIPYWVSVLIREMLLPPLSINIGILNRLMFRF